MDIGLPGYDEFLAKCEAYLQENMGKPKRFIPVKRREY
jgi:hypothetical protein